MLESYNYINTNPQRTKWQWRKSKPAST